MSKAKKPGWKTTEFWLSTLVAANNTLQASGAGTDNAWVQGISAVAAAAVAVFYAQSRAKAKQITIEDAAESGPLSRRGGR